MRDQGRWRVKLYCAAAVLFGFVGIVGAQDASAPAPVPVDEEPMHHVVLRNDAVIAMHVAIPPGERSKFHIHGHDRVAIELCTTTITQQNLNEAEGKEGAVKPGDFSVITLGAAPVIHRVHNTGKTTFEVLDVELLQRPQSPSTKVAGEVAGENPSARVYRWVLAPGASSAMHTHERPYLIVSATPMQLKMTGADGKSMSHEVKAGDFHWVDTKVTHSLSNDGTTEGQIFEIELK